MIHGDKVTSGEPAGQSTWGAKDPGGGHQVTPARGLPVPPGAADGASPLAFGFAANDPEPIQLTINVLAMLTWDPRMSGLLASRSPPTKFSRRCRTTTP